jgi:hypothetical protein
MTAFHHQRAGKEGQVSIPEQNETVKELAGPVRVEEPSTASIGDNRRHMQSAPQLRSSLGKIYIYNDV